MKITIQLAVLLIVIHSSFDSRAQVFSKSTSDEVTKYTNASNALQPCINAAEYTVLNAQCAENIKRLALNDKSYRNALTTSLLWPIRAATNLTDCGYHFIGAYVDQNTATGLFSDFNCESNTYDGHQGTDIAIWPYGFYKMDNALVEVVAAAGGTIVQKADGNFDRNCSQNTLTANSIIVQHADGSRALYWHMKKNSVTSKSVGHTVVAGEYLGAVGSSGSASGPHLHFEVWSGSTSATYKDPFAGTCNILNTNSWWVAQKPHTDSKVIKVSVNTTDIVLPGCPNTETPNETDSFTIPFQGPGLAPGYAKFYVFTRDDNVGLTGDCRIINPNGTTFSSWTFISSAYNKASIRGYSKVLPTVSGTYTFQVTYNGVACSKTFNIVNPLGISDVADLTSIQVYPNPSTDVFTISGKGIENGDYTLILSSIAGQIISSEKMKVEGGEVLKSIPTAKLSRGIYFLSIDHEKSHTVKKIVKQ